MNAAESTSTRPYLIRALYEWCTDNGLTPYVAVSVDEAVQVPREYVKNNEIVLNISFDATSSLKLGNEFIEFKARFAGSAREIIVPISHVIAIYARENGQGMAFPMGTTTGAPVSAGPGTLAVASATVAEGTTTSPAPLGAPDSRMIQLVPESDSGGSGPVEDPPDPPPSSPRLRPPLKRVK